MPLSGVVDQKARDMAQAATSAIERHEEVCAQRWGSAMSTMKDIKTILAYGTASLLAGMAGLIAFLATHTIVH